VKRVEHQTLKLGIVPLFKSCIALLTAVEKHNREMVKLLLQHGADPTIDAKFHDPALQSTNDPEIKRMLQVALRECKAGTRKCGPPR
jgi:hypothetical protein